MAGWGAIRASFRGATGALAVGVACLGAPGFSQSITIDGQTATSVTSAPGGRAIIKIAPSNAQGQSRNTYARFDIEAAGATLDNTQAGASLILNEVTGSAASRLDGPLTVTGQTADVVIANPNGIVVNGGAFQHTGQTLLTTGARDGTQDGLPRYKIESGAISVLEKGLKAQGPLFLLAPELSISGKIETAGALDLAAMRGTARAGNVGALGWVLRAPSGAGGLLTVSSGAMLSGGTIRLEGEGENARVQLAGQGLASAGNFQITASGKVEITGAAEAKKTLYVAASGATAEIETKGSAAAPATLKSQSEAVQLFSDGSLKMAQTEAIGAGRGFFGFSTNAAVSLRADGDATLSDVSLTAQSSDVEIITEAKLDALNVSVTSQKDLIAAAETRLSFSNLSANAEERALIEATSGAVRLSESTLNARLGIQLLGQGIELKSSPETRTQVIASTGGVTFVSTGDILNFGALVQGRAKSAGDDRSEGGVTAIAAGRLLNQSVSETSLASFYATESALTVEAGEIENMSGRLLSEQDTRLTARTRLLNAVLQTGEAHGGVDPVKGPAAFGAFAIGREIGQITAVEALTLKSPTVLNYGGDIAAKTILIETTRFENRPERFGSQSLMRRCILFFCRFTGETSVFHDGGSVAASETLKIVAGESLRNIGGTLTGGTGLTFDSPSIEFEDMLVYETYSRPSGFRGLFRGRGTFQILSFSAGTVASENGALELLADTEVPVAKTTLSFGQNVAMPSALKQRDLDEWLRVRNQNRIGVFRYLLQAG
ncbi:MAG: filamentous hemagglutinin N-terminal domain-containing protein [Pseudomonadota bacterium]